LVIPTVGTNTDHHGQEKQMLWHASITPQWLAPRGEAAIRCAGRPGFLTSDENKYDPERWRS
jgi:hypothetical protein